MVGFCPDSETSYYTKTYLLLAHPGSLRLFRYVGSPEGAGALWQRTGSVRQQQAFLRAINDGPDDDTPRLVYADWLDEHGDPQRAELIRVQCRIAHREQLADVEFGDPDEECQRELSGCNCWNNISRWTAELPELPGVYFSFDGLYSSFRGFPHVVFKTPDVLVRHGDRLLAATALEAITFEKVSRLPLARLLKTPYLDRVCRLAIEKLSTDAEPLLAEWLTSPQAARLRRLTVHPANWTAVLRALTASRHLGRLEKLERAADGVAHRPPEEDVVLALARSPYLPWLRMVSWGWWHTYPGRTKAELRRRFPAIGRQLK